MNATDDGGFALSSIDPARPFDAVREALDRVLDLSGKMLADEGLLEALDWELAGGRPATPGILDQWGTSFTRGTLAAAKVARR